jgi:hypothetical protein
VEFSPNLSGIIFSWTGNTLLIEHDDFDYLTGYTISISTGVLDLSGVAMESEYSFSFVTQNNVYLDYQPDIFEEAIENNGAIKNTINIVLS